MAVFTLEDLQSSIEVMVFPKTMSEVGHLLTDAVVDTVVCVKGRLDTRDDQPKLVALWVEVFEPVLDGAPPVRLKVPAHQLSESLIAELKALLGRFPGESPVFLHLERAPSAAAPRALVRGGGSRPDGRASGPPRAPTPSSVEARTPLLGLRTTVFCE